MGKAVALQALMTMIVAAVAAMIGGRNAALSAALGGLACAIPNALFALRLTFASRTPGGATILGFVVGEFTKVAVTVLLIFGVARGYHGLNWLAFIIGIIAVLKSYFLAFVFRR